MFFNIVYDSQNIDRFEVQKRSFVHDSYDLDNSITITYKLRDNPIVDKFLRTYYHFLNQTTKNLIYNYYGDYNNVERNKIKEKLNFEITKVNSKIQLFNESLLLTDNTSNDFNKLHNIHFIFESKLKLAQAAKLNEEFQNINRYVHLLEVDANSMHFSLEIIKADSNNNLQLPLTDEDFSYKEPSEFGHLLLDENILGKSLFRAALDNDWELIENKLTNQQQSISCAVAIRHRPNSVSPTYMIKKYQSILTRYKEKFSNYDLENPIYTVGDIVLGSPINDNFLNYEYYHKNVTLKYPNLVTFFVSENIP